MRVIGVDVGGTTIKTLPIEVTKGDGAPAATVLGDGERRPTPQGDAAALLAVVADLVKADPDAEAVGLVVPGIVDEQHGLGVFSAALGWENTPIVGTLTEATGLPVALGHDVRGGGVAEWKLGAGRGAADMLFVMLGTGIGSAVIADGRLLVAGGYAGQLGHTVVDPDGEPCGCGQRGCLSTLASASSVVRRYVERSGNKAKALSGGSRGAEPPAGEVTAAKQVAELVRAGDLDAVAVWEEATDALAGGLLTGITVFGSNLVVLGGGLSLAGDLLISAVRKKLTSRLVFQRPPRVLPAELGDESGILGAALLAYERTG